MASHRRNDGGAWMWQSLTMQIHLVPGFMLAPDLWSDMRPALSAFGELVDVDTTRDSSIAAMAERAVDQISANAIVIGFSMGGYVAREMVYRAPHKVAGLALVATSSRASAARSITLQGRSGFRELSRNAVARSLHPDHRSDAIMARVQAMSQRLGGEIFERQSQLVRTDDTARLRDIACPTLIVAAAQDELRSFAESQHLQEHIPRSTMTIIQNCGHLIPLEQPELLAAAIAEAFRTLAN